MSNLENLDADSEIELAEADAALAAMGIQLAGLRSQNHSLTQQLAEAKAELVRLRARRLFFVSEVTMKLAEAKAELVRLRAALEVFADHGMWSQISPQIFLIRNTTHPADFASRALEHKP